MNKMLRDAGYADAPRHNILWFCNTGMHKAPALEHIISAAGADIELGSMPFIPAVPTAQY